MKIFREIKGIKEPEEKKRIAEKDGSSAAPAINVPADAQNGTAAAPAAPAINGPMDAQNGTAAPAVSEPEQNPVIHTVSGSTAEEEEKK